MYDTKFATPVSKAEVTMDNDAYQVVTDPSAYVKFKLVDKKAGKSVASRAFATPGANDEASPVTTGASEEAREETDLSANVYFLAWTTTPWTLMANRMLAVNADFDYGVYAVDGEKFILATKRAKTIFPDQKPLKTIKGKSLAGLKYESLDGTICQVYTADFVGEE